MLRDPPERNMDGKNRADTQTPGGRACSGADPRAGREASTSGLRRLLLWASNTSTHPEKVTFKAVVLNCRGKYFPGDS